MNTHSTDYSLRKMTRGDVLSVGSRLRDSDVLEITLNGRKNRYAGLLKGLEPGYTSYTALIGGVPSALFGIGPSLVEEPTIGLVWFVSTPLTFTAAKIAFGKASFKLLDQMLQDNPQYRYVYNLVHGDNIAAVGWLDRLGFTFEKTHHIYDMLFHTAVKHNPYFNENV